MGQKRSYKQYPKAFEEEVVSLVLEQGYSVAEAAKSLGIAAYMQYRWKQNIEDQKQGQVMAEDFIGARQDDEEAYWQSYRTIIDALLKADKRAFILFPVP